MVPFWDYVKNKKSRAPFPISGNVCNLLSANSPSYAISMAQWRVKKEKPAEAASKEVPAWLNKRDMYRSALAMTFSAKEEHRNLALLLSVTGMVRQKKIKDLAGSF